MTKEDVELLEGAEQEEARARKTWDFKYISDDKMLEVIAARKAARQVSNCDVKSADKSLAIIPAPKAGSVDGNGFLAFFYCLQ